MTQRQVPVVILSSSHESSDLEESYRLGINAYVVKPIHFVEFAEAVKQIGVLGIGQPAAGRDARRMRLPATL